MSHPVQVSLRTHLLQPDWPGFDFIIFDCDSTLSTIEGIDELARQKGKFNEVKKMTDAAMEGEIHLQNVYDRRLELLNPTRAEIRALERQYRLTVVPDAPDIIKALKFFGKELFIVSGGLLAAVRPFGEWLGIPRQNIRAVDVRYNRLSGRWWDYQQDQWGQRPDVEYLDSEATPLIESQGKADVARDLLQSSAGRSLLIGDGMSDLAARPAVDLVVGFGGVITRQNVLNEAEVFVRCPTLAPLLPLALSGQQCQQEQDTPYNELFRKGWNLIETGEVLFRDDN
ncbi:MAG: HAD-IB family phosphatase [Anaerolineae bacterium]|nr:HAD-IB family phosphatase [Anaerolineae bacterium]